MANWRSSELCFRRLCLYGYYVLEPYGLEDDEVELEPDKNKQPSWLARFRKPKKDVSQNKFAYDDHVEEGEPDGESGE